MLCVYYARTLAVQGILHKQLQDSTLLEQPHYACSKIAPRSRFAELTTAIAASAAVGVGSANCLCTHRQILVPLAPFGHTSTARR